MLKWRRSSDGRKLQAIAEADGLIAYSSWWHIDDGSAEEEALKELRAMQQKEQEIKEAREQEEREN